MKNHKFILFAAALTLVGVSFAAPMTAKADHVTITTVESVSAKPEAYPEVGRVAYKVLDVATKVVTLLANIGLSAQPSSELPMTEAALD